MLVKKKIYPWELNGVKYSKLHLKVLSYRYVHNLSKDAESLLLFYDSLEKNPPSSTE